MGFLETGTRLSWEESQKIIAYVKEHGIRQFLHSWKHNKARKDRILCWGDELEYTLVKVLEDQLQAQIYPDACRIIEELKVRESLRSKGTNPHLSSEWHPEFGNHMVEALPSPPFFLNLNSLLILEPSMRLRRAKIQSVLTNNRFVVSLPTVPRLGLSGFSEQLDDMVTLGKSTFVKPKNTYRQDQQITPSFFISDEVYNPHPRFPGLVHSVTARRNAPIFIEIPAYKDKYTGLPPSEVKHRVSEDQKNGGLTVDSDAEEDAAYAVEGDWALAQDSSSLDRFSVRDIAQKTINPSKDMIYMDCLGFGFTMCCLQTTFACPEMFTARYLYDQFVVLAPIFLALSSCTPFHRGLLSDYDSRWSALEQSTDCRTAAEETGNLNNDHSFASATAAQYIPKSRYSSVSLYISDDDYVVNNEALLNDTVIPQNQAAYDLLTSEGVDHMLAKHFAYLWTRDPLVVFKERVYLDDTKAVDHFENIQSTNWHSVRFKPPHQIMDAHNPIGWRVEFRSPDIQLTDWDNAALVGVISVLAQTIMYYKLNLYIPMSMNDENMRRSWRRDSVTEGKFFFRKTLRPVDNILDDIEEMSIYEILMGKPSSGYVGLITMCEKYINEELNGSAAAAKSCASMSSSSRVPNRTDLPSKSGSNVDSVTSSVPPQQSPSQDASVFPPLAGNPAASTAAEKSFSSLKLPSNVANTGSEAPPQKQATFPHTSQFGQQIRLYFSSYASLLIDRASGKCKTGARLLRDFVLAHPRYRHDSIINSTIDYDLNVLAILLGFGVWTSPQLHGEFVARHMIQQTPLLSELKLPQLSPYGAQVIQWLPEKVTEEVGELRPQTGVPPSQKLTLIKRKTIALNEINSIYTMPIGVTTRMGNLQKLSAGAGNEMTSPPMGHTGSASCQFCALNRDLVRLTLEFIEHNKEDMKEQRLTRAASNLSRLNSVISSEDFTQAWIMKGMDYVGGLDPYGVDSSTQLGAPDGASVTNLSGPDYTETASLNSSIKKHDESVDCGSTVCPSACEDRLFNLDDDQMHEISRSFSFGFKDEQELEYFQQVAEASG